MSPEQEQKIAEAAVKFVKSIRENDRNMPGTEAFTSALYRDEREAFDALEKAIREARQ